MADVASLVGLVGLLSGASQGSAIPVPARLFDANAMPTIGPGKS
jgi:hypothetical protein